MSESEYEEFKVKPPKRIKVTVGDGFEILEEEPPLRYSKHFIDWRNRLFILKQLPRDRWFVVGELGTESSCYSTKDRLRREYSDIEFRPVGVKLYARVKVQE